MKSRRIVIADQNPVFREGFRKILINSGNAMIVGEAKNSQELLTLLKNEKADILFIESRLPGGDAVILVNTIHHLDPMLEIFAISSFDNFRYVSRMREVGARGYLSKNADNQDVIEKIIRKKIRTFINPVNIKKEIEETVTLSK
jgi:DNA-binding NarL/FixJ family response regulator